MKILRYYQDAAVRSTKEFNGYGGLIVCPTGSGKALCIADICKQNPYKKILVLAHRAELIRQNVAEFEEHTGETAGIWSASLKQKTKARVTFAQVQSAYTMFWDVDLIIIDEAHLIPTRESSMYQRLLGKASEHQLIGLTATEYRLDIGHLTRGNDSLFSKIIYKIDYDKLVSEGYLAALKYKSSKSGIKNSEINLKNGEIDQKIASEKIEPKLAQIIEDVKQKQIGRTLWFCPTVELAESVANATSGQAITGETKNRESLLKDFSAFKFQNLTNVEVLTTGFNEPKIETIVFLRPTQSTALFKQMLGRGTRLADLKTSCLILDYTTNTEVHGFLGDDTYPNAKGISPEYKCCPYCEEVIKVRLKVCPACDWEFQSVPMGERKPLKSLNTVSHDPDAEYLLDVVNITASKFYSMNTKKNSIKVDFKVKGGTFSKWIPERGFYTNQFLGKLGARASYLFNPDQVIAVINNCKMPERVLAKKKGKYFEFLDFV